MKMKLQKILGNFIYEVSFSKIVHVHEWYDHLERFSRRSQEQSTTCDSSEVQHLSNRKRFPCLHSLI